LPRAEIEDEGAGLAGADVRRPKRSGELVLKDVDGPCTGGGHENEGDDPR
jgi:hypothetical protein